MKRDKLPLVLTGLQPALEGWWTDPARDGSTPAGSVRLIGAKLVEAFKESTENIARRRIMFDELETANRDLRKKLQADIDIREAMGYVPLGRITRHLSLDGELVRNHKQLVREFERIIAVGKAREAYFTAGTKFLEKLKSIYQHALRDPVTAAGQLKDAYRHLDVADMRKLISHAQPDGSRISDEYLGGWFMLDETQEAHGREIPEGVKAIVPKLRRTHWDEPKGAIATHIKPKTKDECLELLGVLDEALKVWNLPINRVDHFDHLMLDVVYKLNSEVQSSGHEDSADPAVEKALATLNMNEEDGVAANVYYFIEDYLEDAALRNLKTLAHLVDYSIRRMR